MSIIWSTLAASAERLAAASPGYVLGALCLYAVSLLIAGSRWLNFLRALGASTTLWRATLATLGGIAVSNLMPSSRVGGEACRIALVRQRDEVTWKQATIATVWDRLAEVPPILLLVLVSVPAVRHLPSRWQLLAMVLGGGVALCAGGLAIRSFRRNGSSLAGWRERLSLDRIRLRVFAIGVGYSSLTWIQDVLRLTCATRALGVALSPGQTATLSVLTILGGLAPTVGGIGPVEGGLMAGLLAFGVDVPTAAAITAVERLISLGLSTLSGSVVIALLGGRSIWHAARRRSLSIETP